MATEEKKIILDLSINYASISKGLEDTTKKIVKLKDENQKLKESIGAAIIAGDSAEQQKLQALLVENQAQTKALTQDNKNLEKQSVLLAQANKASAGSYESLLRQQQLAQITLKNLEGTLKKNADGTFVLTDEYKKASAQVKTAKDAVLAFDKGISDGRTNVGNYAQSIEQAFQSTGLFSGELGKFKDIFSAVKQGTLTAVDGVKTFRQGVSESVGVMNDWFVTSSKTNDTLTSTATSTKNLGGAINTTTSTGVKGFQALKAAIASTGIGLLVIIFASVVNYLRQIDPLVEKFEQGFAAVSAVVTVIGKAFTDLFSFLFSAFTDLDGFLEKLSFANAVNGLKAVNDEATRAAQKAIELKQREQELEDARVKTLITSSKLIRDAKTLRQLADDKTLSDEKRINALVEANNKEKQAKQEQLKNERELLLIQKERLAESIKLNTQQDDQVKQVAEQAAKVQDLVQEIKDTEIKANAETSRVRNQQLADRSAAIIGALTQELRALTIAGQETIEKRKQIAKAELDVVIQNSSISNELKLVAEKKYQNDIAEINKEALDKNKAIQQQITQNSIDSLIDGKTKELAVEANALNVKLDAIKGESSQEIALRESLIAQSSLKVLEIEKKYAALSIEQNKEIAEDNKSILIQQSNEIATAQENALKLQLAQGIISKEDAAKKSEEIQLEAAQRELQILLNNQAALQAQDASFYASQQAILDESLNNKLISQEDYQAQSLKLKTDYDKQTGETEVATQTEINTQLAEINQLKVDSQIAGITATNEAQQNQLALEQQIAQSRLAIASSLIGGLAALMSTDEKNRKKYGAALKVLAVAEVGVNLSRQISANNAAYSIASVQAALAGPSALAAIQAARVAANIEAVVNSIVSIARISAQKFEKGGFTANVNGINSTYSDSIADGGYISSPTFGQIGERGTELVISNKTLKQAPSYFANIERWNRTGIRPFADGGFTTTSFVAPMPTSIDYEAMRSIIVDAVSSMPNPVTYIEDIQQSNQRVNEVRAKGNI